MGGGAVRQAAEHYRPSPAGKPAGGVSTFQTAAAALEEVLMASQIAADGLGDLVEGSSGLGDAERLAAG